MSEKKSKYLERKLTCSVCAEESSDFLELEDLSDIGFILCCECEARATSEDLYEAYNTDEENALTRENILINSLNSRTSEVVATAEAHLQASEKEMI